jgi:hypothetical protein
MKELKRDVDQKQAEKEAQQLAFQQQLAAAEAKQREYGDYYQIVSEKGRIAAELEAERQARLRLEAAVLQPRPQPMSIERPGNVHERTA